MNYFILDEADQPLNNWILFHETPRVEPLERYKDLRCPDCGKINECEALHRGIDPSIKIHAETDFVSTNDGLLCVSTRAAGIIRARHVWGIELLEIPNDGRYWVVRPNPLICTDPATCGMQFLKPCAKCGRFKETRGGAGLWSMQLPENQPAIFASEIWRESARCRELDLWADEAAIELIKSSHLTGVSWTKGLRSLPASRGVRSNPNSQESLDSIG